MKTEKEALFCKVENVARDRFPMYTVVAECDPSDSGCIGVGVYGVPRERVSAVRNAIYDLEEELFPNGECCLSAFVRDLDFTRQCCSQYLPVPQEEAIDLGQLCLHLSQKSRCGWVDITPPIGVAAIRQFAAGGMDLSSVTDFFSSECKAKWSPDEGSPSSEVLVAANNFDQAA